MAVRGYIRYPTISGDRIAFTAEDDLWLVSASGGRAERLTAGVSEMSRARFSPDGTALAYTGCDEGPAEVYVLPLEGGPPRRLTYLGATSQVVGWRPDGSGILFASNAAQFTPRKYVLFEISPSGGEPVQLPYGPANGIAFGPAGQIVLGRNLSEPARRKRYRGGTVGHLWIDPIGNGEFQRLLDLDTNIGSFCWAGERIYFIADHDGIGNVYSCLPSGDDLRRHTHHADYYARGLAGDGRRLVYHAGGDLYTLEPDATAPTRLDVTLSSVGPQRARSFVSAATFLESWTPHPDGDSIALTTRGKAFSMPSWEGPVSQHGNRDGVRYRHLGWLGDGKRLVAVGDDGTEPRLVAFSGSGLGERRILDGLDIGNVIELRPAPRGSLVALVNHRNEIQVIDVDTGSVPFREISPYGRNENESVLRGLAWSPDARWLAYTFGTGLEQTAIKVAEVATGSAHQVTEPVLRDDLPAFDPGGRFLYFRSSRDYDPIRDNLHFDLGFPKGMRPYLLTLRRNIPSPFLGAPMPAPPAVPAQGAAPSGHADGQDARQASTPSTVEIDFDGIADRIIAFPVPEGRYGRVCGTADGVAFSSFPIEGTRYKPRMATAPEANGTLESYTFATRKQECLADGISDFEVTPDGKTLLYRAGERLRQIAAGTKLPEGNSPGRDSGGIDLDRVKVSIQPAAEWRQMFGEAWRLQREQFWISDLGGVDWQRARDLYAPLLDHIGSRAELSDVLWELQGELGSSHAYEIGGAYRSHPDYPQGSLGVDWRFSPDTGRYTIAHLLRGDPWDPEATSPLLAPGINAAIGDAVLAINGQPITREFGPRQALVNLAGAEAQLLLGPQAGGEPRAVTVHVLGDERRARYRDWVEANRRTVREVASGRVGYLHLIDMAENGFGEFHRAYLAEYDHDALIVDIRWNGGGYVTALLLSVLARPRLGYAFQRWGPATPFLNEAPRGPLVALTDENAGSDGDIFSHAFKMLGLGPLIGARTWGGVIGIDPYIPLADGTVTTQPEFSFWFRDVGWGIENRGVEPTIPVDFPPQAAMRGQDPQLERAIAEALRLADERPSATPTPQERPYRGLPR